MPSDNRSKRKQILIASTILLVGLVIYLAIPGTQKLTIAPETTVDTEHVLADGQVDYIIALNTRLRGKVTPAQNAMVSIWKGVGPHPENGTLPAEYFEWLGQPAPPEKGRYLINWSEFNKPPVDQNLNQPPRDAALIEALNARRDRAVKWPWKSEEDPEIAAWVEKNRKPLEAFAQASQKIEYYNPLVPTRDEHGHGQIIACLLPHVQCCREAANLLAVRAMQHLGEGRVAEAWQDLMICHRLGRLMEKGGTLIEYLVGVAIQSIAMQGEIVFLSQPNLSPKLLANCGNDLQGLMPHSKIADKVDLTERFTMLNCVQYTSQMGMGFLNGLSGEGHIPDDQTVLGKLFSRSTDWNVTLKLANAWYDRWTAAARIEDLQARELTLKQLEVDLKNMMSEARETMWLNPILFSSKRGENFGKILVGLLLPAIEKILAAELRIEQQHRNLALALALAMFRSENGRYPQQLSELSPKYLAVLPKDIYTNEAVKYRLSPTGYLLYSVGPNRVDDGGRDKQNNHPGDDLSITMPVPMPGLPKMEPQANPDLKD